MSSLRGKVALVTAASRGIGRAVAERLGHDGASVVVNFLNSRDRAEEVVGAIRACGGHAVAIQADVSRPQDIRRLFDQTLGHFGRLDILVANAGVSHFAPLAEATAEDFDAVFALNARGTFFCLQEAARRMADGGRIVNISSSVTQGAMPETSFYGASKAAGEQFVRVLAHEIGPRQITVNTVSPGFTDTDMAASHPQFRAIGATLSPLGRLGRPADVAGVIAFVVSEDARWLTGQTIQAGGGVRPR
jgi:3-oxoacyl-[acyl-carrier protein] reductase